MLNKTPCKDCANIELCKHTYAFEDLIERVDGVDKPPSNWVTLTATCKFFRAQSLMRTPKEFDSGRGGTNDQ